ncbi:DUF1045 domain-containing protein [Rhodobacter sp.]
MEMMKRYAVYYAPPAGEFWDRASRWLGWDAAAGMALVPPDLGVDAEAITRDPRKYGFHATLKPPFRLAEGVTPQALEAGLAAMARGLSPVMLDGLRLKSMGGFLALVPEGDTRRLETLAGEVVRGLDSFRAPLTEAEVARRCPDRLSPRQRELLDRYGYPFVMEEYRFHLTLTDRLPEAKAAEVSRILTAHFAPVLPRPFPIGDLCLFGEAQDGRFHLLHRYALSG